MKRFVVLGLALLPLALPARVHAQAAVIDASNLVQTTATAISTYNTLQQMYEQVKTAQNQLRNQVESLRTLDPTSFASLKQAVADGQFTFEQLKGDIDSFGYGVKSVNSDFQRLFPSSKAKWSKVKADDFGEHYGAWQGQIATSSLTAARAQSSVERVEQYNGAAGRILLNSEGAAGEVRQLQSITQMLGVMQMQLSNLLTSMTTIGRLTADIAASMANQKMMAAEASSRRAANYTDRGRPVPVMKKLP
jgi:P-type conjugative transfer protein TrbJ